MGQFNTGIVNPAQVQSVTPNSLFGVAINWFAPRTPLIARLRKTPNGNPSFSMVGHKYRPRTGTLGAAVADGTTTTITLADASFLMQGDILKLASGEFVEVTADPNTTANTIVVRRGVAGTTGAAQSNSTAFTVIANSRTGAEDGPTAISTGFTTVQQYMQTIQHPYSVGGGVNSNVAFPVAPGVSTPLEQYRMDAMQNCMDDAEYAAYFGRSEANSAGAGRAKMIGLRQSIVTNLVPAPSDASAYKATSFQRDLLTKPRKSGGQPDVVFVASNWMDAFATWSLPLQLLVEGTTAFGRQIKVFTAPFLGGVTIVEASLLPDFSAFSLTSEEVDWQVKRPLADTQYGISGDNTKGHMLQELAICIRNENHHAWLEGVTGFSN